MKLPGGAVIAAVGCLIGAGAGDGGAVLGVGVGRWRALRVGRSADNDVRVVGLARHLELAVGLIVSLVVGVLAVSGQGGRAAVRCARACAKACRASAPASAAAATAGPKRARQSRHCTSASPLLVVRLLRGLVAILGGDLHLDGDGVLHGREWRPDGGGGSDRHEEGT